MLVAISFVALRKKEPQLERPFKVANGKLIGYIAVVISIFYISLYLPIGPGSLIWPCEWLMILGWVLIGIVLAIMAKQSYENISESEREYLIFGEEYGRKKFLSDDKQR